MTRYYSLQSHIYDATRPAFLFGRETIIDDLRLLPGETVLEIGCGTGHNFDQLVKQVGPYGAVFGVDCSSPMLEKCWSRILGKCWSNVHLIDREYGDVPLLGGSFDAVLMSYSLSMIPGWEQALQCATAELKPGGRIGIVDFCLEQPTKPASWFCEWMKLNNVVLDRPYLQYLGSRFDSDLQFVEKAFGGLWTFYRFVGRPA